MYGCEWGIVKAWHDQEECEGKQARRKLASIAGLTFGTLKSGTVREELLDALETIDGG